VLLVKHSLVESFIVYAMARLGWWTLTALWMLVIWRLSDQPDLSSGLEHDFLWRKLAHVLEFALLTWLWLKALAVERGDRSAVWWVLLAVVGYAVLDEWHQTWVMGRSGRATDMLIDTVGILAVAWWYCAIWPWRRLSS